MKKILVAIASVLALGIFASCQNGAQDVNVTGSNYWNTEYDCTVSGTYTKAQTKTDTTSFKLSDDSKTYDVTADNGHIKSTECSDSNVVLYELKADLTYKPAGDPYYSWEPISLDVKKVDDKYYFGRGNKSEGTNEIAVTVDGDIDDDEFTITIPSEVVIDSTGFFPVSIADGYKLKFVRK